MLVNKMSQKINCYYSNTYPDSGDNGGSGKLRVTSPIRLDVDKCSDLS